MTGKEHPDRGTANEDADSVVTANEAGGWHRGRLVLRTVSEDDDLIVFHNDHVEHDMNGLKKRRMSPWRLQERQVKNIVIEAQRTKNQITPWVKVTTHGASIRSLRQVLSCYKSATT